MWSEPAEKKKSAEYAENEDKLGSGAATEIPLQHITLSETQSSFAAFFFYTWKRSHLSCDLLDPQLLQPLNSTCPSTTASKADFSASSAAAETKPSSSSPAAAAAQIAIKQPRLVTPKGLLPPLLHCCNQLSLYTTNSQLQRHHVEVLIWLERWQGFFDIPLRLIG